MAVEGPPGLGYTLGGGPELGTGAGGALGRLSAVQHPQPSGVGEGQAIPPSCGCNWFSSLSLPPSLLLCVFLSAVSVNLCATPCASLPSPTLRLSGAPHSSAFPSRLVLPAFSLSAPGGRYKAGPSLLPDMTQGEGAALASGP